MHADAVVGGLLAAHVAATGGGVGQLSVGDATLGHGFAALASLSRTDARFMAAIDADADYDTFVARSLRDGNTGGELRADCARGQRAQRGSRQ